MGVAITEDPVRPGRVLALSPPIPTTPGGSTIVVTIHL